MKINYLLKRIPHHSQHAGYDLLSKHIRCRIVEQNLVYRILNYCPERILAQLRKSAGSYYGSKDLKNELQNIPDFIFRSNSIYHFLYGDDLFHYSGYLNPRKSNKLVATFHLPPEKFLKVTPSTQHLKKLDAAIIVAPNQASLFNELVGREKVHLIPHGINIHFFRPLKTKQHKKTCLFVGSHLRDFKMLKKVIFELNKKDKEICFKIVNSKISDEEFSTLKNVKHYSYISEEHLRELYSSSGLLLLPVTDSTANNSLLEAIACGLPVVTTNAGGIGYYLNNKCSVMVNNNDASAMADTVIKILNNPDLRNSMSVEARKKAAEYDWKEIVKQTEQLYFKLLPQT